MSDADDAVAKAVALNKKLAATKLVRKEELEAELLRLRRERDLIEGDAPELDAQLDAVATDLAVADGELKSALGEIDQLRKLGRGAEAGRARAMVNAALGEKDPLIQTYEEAALDGARAHIRDLDAQVRLNDELGGSAGGDAPAVAPARTKPLSKEEANERARAEFEAMRARRGQPGQAAPATPAATSGDPPGERNEWPQPSNPPKKTM